MADIADLDIHGNFLWLCCPLSAASQSGKKGCTALYLTTLPALCRSGKSRCGPVQPLFLSDYFTFPFNNICKPLFNSTKLTGIILASVTTQAGITEYKMNKILRNTAAAALFGILAAGAANAGIYTEDFEQPFPAWERDWFGTMSDAINQNCISEISCSERGNNPDGLWLGSSFGNGALNITFSTTFGASLTSFTLGVAGYAPTTLSAYDMDGMRILAQDVTLTRGATTDPGSYAYYTITSVNGISRFAFSGNAAGNTSIDNLVAITNDVPEPATLGLLGLGLLGLAAARRRSRAA